MTKEGYAKLAFILAIIAAALALSAALFKYVRRGEVNFSMIAAGLFMLAFGFSMKSRNRG